MALLEILLQQNEANRLADLSYRESGQVVHGDFSGSVTGTWVRFSNDGAGIVSYNKKLYITRPIGFTSIPAGTVVELSFANGVYYSKW